jgi:hypothetical protein
MLEASILRGRAGRAPSRVRAWLALPYPEQVAVFRMALLVCACSVGLHTLGVRRMMAWAAGPVLRASAADADSAVAAAVKALGRVGRHSPRPGTCLSRSLALQRWLSRSGVDSTLRFGGRVVNASLDAHAWVERDGAILNDTPDVADRFAPLHAGGQP